MPWVFVNLFTSLYTLPSKYVDKENWHLMKIQALFWTKSSIGLKQRKYSHSLKQFQQLINCVANLALNLDGYQVTDRDYLILGDLKYWAIFQTFSIIC